MLSSKIHDLRHLGLGDFVSKDTALADTVMMNMQHDLGRRFNILLKEFFQNKHHKFHGRVVIVQNQHAIEVWTLNLGFDFGDDRGSRPSWSPRTILVTAHMG